MMLPHVDTIHAGDFADWLAEPVEAGGLADLRRWPDRYAAVRRAQDRVEHVRALKARLGLDDRGALEAVLAAEAPTLAQAADAVRLLRGLMDVGPELELIAEVRRALRSVEAQDGVRPYDPRVAPLKFVPDAFEVVQHVAEPLDAALEPEPADSGGAVVPDAGHAKADADGRIDAAVDFDHGDLTMRTEVSVSGISVIAGQYVDPWAAQGGVGPGEGSFGGLHAGISGLRFVIDARVNADRSDAGARQ